MFLHGLSKLDSFKLTGPGVNHFKLSFPDITETIDTSTIFRVIGIDRVADLGNLIIIQARQGTMRYSLRVAEARKIEVTTSLVS
jgi:hypothetical protein